MVVLVTLHPQGAWVGWHHGKHHSMMHHCWASCKVWMMLQVTLHPQGVWASLCAPRVCCLQQIVRETEEGTLLLLFSEKDEPGAQPEHPAWWNWFAPVPVRVSPCRCPSSIAIAIILQGYHSKQ